MKKIIIFLFLFTGLLARTQTTIVADGIDHLMAGSEKLIADKYYYLSGPSSYEWNISIPWSADSCSTTKIFLQCLTGNKWSNYISDSLISLTATARTDGLYTPATTTGLGYFWDDKLCFSRLRIFVDVTSKDTVTIKGVYYRAVRKYTP
jgi:hypothetical protein